MNITAGKRLRSLRLAASLLGGTLAIACTSSTSDSNSSARLQAPVSRTSDLDHCAAVTMTSQGQSPLDDQISRAQHRITLRVSPIPHLEQLGWLYVAKARHTSDPGFYKLAQLTADCLDRHTPASLEAKLLRGHVHHQLHEFRAAESVARELVALRGRWFDWGLLGDALMEQGKLRDAADAYQRMMNERPGPQAYSRAAHLRWLTGDVAGAAQLMAMAAHSSSARDAEAAAWIYTRLAQLEWQLGAKQEAERHLSAALKFLEVYAPALYAQGRLHMADGEWQLAAEKFERAVNHSPLPEYQWALFEALRKAGQEHRAREVAAMLGRSGIQEDPRTFALYLASSGLRLEEAVQLARAELAKRADVFTLDTLAWALHVSGHFEEARTLSERALAEDTEDARLLYHAAIILGGLDEPSRAHALIARARRLSFMLLPSEAEHLEQHLAAMSPTNRLAVAAPMPDISKP